MRHAVVSAFAVVSVLGGGTASAQDYPTKEPIRMIVGFAAGGGTDSVARLLAEELGKQLRQTVIVENRAGAGGVLATSFVAKAAPSGYIVSFNLNSHSINQALYPSLPFDTERDLRGVTLVGTLPQLLAAHPSASANSFHQFIEQAKAGSESSRRFAHGGIGSPGHLAGAAISSAVGVPLLPIPYKGAGPAINDVLGNHVPYVISTMAGLLPYIQTGKLKALAITSPTRSPMLPDVPTIAESGIKNYDMDTWMGTFVPKATPDSVVKILHEATLRSLKNPALRTRISDQGGRIIGGEPTELDRLVTLDIQKFRKLVKDAGIKAE